MFHQISYTFNTPPPLINNLGWCYFLIFGLYIVQCTIFDAQTEENEARQKIDATSIGLRFNGNQSAPNFFKLLERDGDYLLIGARNVVYNISIETFQVRTSIIWPPQPIDTEMCLKKGKSENDCHNYIRILAKDKAGVLVCGTNAYKPMCRRYRLQGDSYIVTSQFSGVGVTPYDPTHNSTAYYEPEVNLEGSQFSGALYAGTVADFGATDALVSRRSVPNSLRTSSSNFTDDSTGNGGLRTQRNDIKCLNEPNFVASFADASHVYFWLRENAVEYMNCGKAVYSRVARVCKNDRAGLSKANSDQQAKKQFSIGLWTSFVKARLNCSLPGEFPFYFDELASVTSLVDSATSANEDQLIYAVFNTPYSEIRGSAVCAFSMQEVQRVFRSSAFKSQQTPDSNWLPLNSEQQRPLSECSSDGRPISDEILNFVRKNSLLDGVVQNYFASPIIVQTGFKRFTQIAVDRNVPTIDPKIRFDVIFVATDDGKVLKLLNLATKTHSVQTIVVEVVQIFQSRVSINNLLIYKIPNLIGSKTNSLDESDELIVVSEEQVRSIPLYNCHRSISCNSCVRLQDPYCAWDLDTKVCAGSGNGWPEMKNLVQNVTSGISALCFTSEMIDDAAMLGNSLDHFVMESKRINVSIDKKSCKCSGRSFENFEATENDLQSIDKVSSVRMSSFAGGSSNHKKFTTETFLLVIILSAVLSALIGILIGLHLSSYPRIRRMFTCQNKIDNLKKPKLKPNESIHSNNSSQFNQSIHSANSVKPLMTTSYSNQNKPVVSTISQAPINAYEYETRPQRVVSRSDSSATQRCDDVIGDGGQTLTNFSTLPKDYRVKKTYL